jgi:hypothetical protein
LLRSGLPAEPSSAEFAERLAAAGKAFSNAGVAAVYLVHGTFCGNDALGLFTELERWAPKLTARLRRGGKRMFDALIGETGNYLPSFARRMEEGLNAGVDADESRIGVRLFHWSSQNHHIGRADAAVRLIDELAAFATNLSVPSPLWGWEQTSTGDPKSPERSAVVRRDSDLGRGFEEGTPLTAPPLTPPHQGEGNNGPRVQLWSHSHGGNAFALLTNLLGGDAATRAEFFEAGKYYFRSPWTRIVDLPVWQRVEQILSDADHPVRRLPLDLVTFGTPIRYGWDTLGYSKLLHIVHHRPVEGQEEYHGPRRLRLGRMLRAVHGDYVNQLGIAGSNLPPLPLAMRTFIADRRMRQLVERGLMSEWIGKRIRRGMRVPDEGSTLLVDYADLERVPWRHLLGHAPYTRSRWLPLHCELVAESFYHLEPKAVGR